MDILQVIVLSIVQGISEFLPISSSAHLILVPKLLGWADQGLAFDIALHVGTLLAILWYFREDLIPLIKDFFASIYKRETVGRSNLAWAVIIGTIPVGIIGLLCKDFIEENFRSPLVIAFSTIFFGLILWLGDTKAGKKELLSLTLKVAFVIGVAQAIALIPGTSRSGITMSAAMLLGFSRTSSARFSFLLSIPVITLAGLLASIDLMHEGVSEPYGMLLLAVVFSGISAYFCIKFFMALLSKSTMIPFVIYRFILGIFLLYLFL